MYKLLHKIIDNAKNNPISTGAFALLLACITFCYNHEIIFAEIFERLEKNYIEISPIIEELDRTKSIIDLWERTNFKIDSLNRKHTNLLSKPGYKISAADVLSYYNNMIKSRVVLNDIIISSTSTHINNDKLSNIFNDINEDALYIDKFLKDRIDFLELFIKDPKKYRIRVKEFMMTVEDYRRYTLIDKRLNNMYSIYNSENEICNSIIRIDKEQRRIDKLNSILAIISWTYIGGYFGYWIGIGIRIFRRNRKRNDMSANK